MRRERQFVLSVCALFLVFAMYFAWHIRSAYLVIPADLSQPLPLSPFSAWREFASEDGQYVVSLPTIAQHATDTMANPQTKEIRHYDMNVAERSNGTTFVITRIAFSSEEGQPLNRDLSYYRQEVIASAPDNKVISQEEGEFAGHQAVSMVVENPKAVSHVKLFFVDDTLYLLMVIASQQLVSQDMLPQSDIDHFFQSFHLLPAANNVRKAEPAAS